jgi:TRAP-type C4-dicarboxylate transport system permease small subunit
MQHPILALLARLDRALALTLKWICIALFVAITFILTLNIVVRFVPVMSMHWFDEILELLYGALIFYGAAAVWIQHGHFSVGDWLSQRLRSIPARMAYRFVVELCSLVFMVIFLKYAFDLTVSAEEQTTVFSMPKKWLYACMPITGTIMVIYSVKNMVLALLQIANPSLHATGGDAEQPAMH